MSEGILLKGYLTKRSSRGGNIWRKRFFVLYSDGRLTCSEKKGAPPKYQYVLSPTSRLSSIPQDELKSERGFFITFNSGSSSSDVLCVKSSKKHEVEQWDKIVRKLLAHMGTSASYNQTRSQLQMASIYESSRPGAANSATRKGSASAAQGYVMKVGRDDGAGDYFVNAHTFEYFYSEEDCIKGAKPVGKATLNVLV